MSQKDVEQKDELVHGDDPWWARLGTRGAVALIAVGGLAAVWVFFRLPGVPDNLASGYYQAAKVAVIGVVIAGCALLGRRRERTSEGPDEPERA